MARMTWARDFHRVTAPLRRNVGAKLFAAVFAFMLWFFVNAGERDTQVFQFPIELRNAPQRTVVANADRVETVAVKLNGPAALLASLDTRRAPIVIDLSTLPIGTENRVKVRDEMVRVPRGVRVLDVDPGRVPVLLEEVTRIQLPVNLVSVGTPKDGFRVKGIKVFPQKVAVTGPAGTLGKLKAIDTEPLDLGGLSASTQRAVALVRNDQGVALKPERVTADVDVEAVLASRDFKRLDVEVRAAEHPFQLRPTRVNLTVRGPERIVQTLELPPGSVFVDAADYGPGDHTVKPDVALPADVEIVKIDPPTLRLVMTQAKDGARR